jgi:hypothetical protein
VMSAIFSGFTEPRPTSHRHNTKIFKGIAYLFFLFSAGELYLQEIRTSIHLSAPQIPMFWIRML